MKTFVICSNDNSVWLVGPFENSDAVKQHFNASTYDPRWNVVELEDLTIEDEAARIPVYSPDNKPA